MNLVENYCIRQGRNGLLPPLPTGVGPAGSWVLDGADGDLEHRIKFMIYFFVLERSVLMILRGVLIGKLRKNFHTQFTKLYSL